MSTRCVVKITKNKKSIELYHHCDGYIEGIGFFLAKEMNKYAESSKDHCFCPDVNSIVTKLVRENNFEITFCNHCDIEYYYEVDFDKKTVIGLSVNNWEKRMEIYERFDCIEELKNKFEKDVHLYEGEE